LGFSLSFAPGHYWPRTSGRGPIMNTDRELRLRHLPEPPIDVLTHYVRPRVAALIGRSRRCFGATPRPDTGTHEARLILAHQRLAQTKISHPSVAQSRGGVASVVRVSISFHIKHL
jgi:hypothetical protein